MVVQQGRESGVGESAYLYSRAEGLGCGQAAPLRKGKAEATVARGEIAG